MCDIAPLLSLLYNTERFDMAMPLNMLYAMLYAMLYTMLQALFLGPGV